MELRERSILVPEVPFSFFRDKKGMAHKSVTLVDLGNMLYYVQGFDSVRKYHEFAVDHLSYVTDLEAACCS